MTRILLTGRTGQLGWELREALPSVGEVTALGREAMDLSEADSIRRAIREIRPQVIVNAAGYTTVDQAEDEPGLAMQVNGTAPGVMAEEAKRLGALLVHYSTDYVYDGVLDRPYGEDDPPHPLNVYGASKLAGERAIEAVGGTHLILRTSWIYSDRGSNFMLTILRLAREKRELPVVDDQIGSPTWARALADASIRVLRQRNAGRGPDGTYHLSASGHTSRYGFAREIVSAMRDISGMRDGWAQIKAISTARYPFPLKAKRPLHPVTDKAKIVKAFGIAMPDWQDQLRRCLAAMAAGSEWRRVRA